MFVDFLNFFILFLMITVTFALIGNINFLYDIKKFEGFFESILTIIDASLGNYDFKVFDDVNDPIMKIIG